MSKSAKTNLIYLGLGLIPILLLLLPQADPKGTFVHAFTKVFPYPLYMGFALVGFLCFKINQIRILFSVLLFRHAYDATIPGDAHRRVRRGRAPACRSRALRITISLRGTAST